MHFTLADLITDITQNGVESGASIVELQISETMDSGEPGSSAEPGGSDGKGEFRFTVIDNGKGMTEEELKRAQDPFVTDGIKHPHRKVGLGLPFLIQTAEASGGGWKMESKKAGQGQASGTVISAWFDMGNVDTPPLGDIPGMFRTVLLFGGPEEMVIKRVRKSPSESKLSESKFSESKFSESKFSESKFSESKFSESKFSESKFSESKFSENKFSENKFSENKFSENKFSENKFSGDLDYEVRKTELSGALGDLEDTQSLILLDRYLRSLEEDGE
jgi:hypothetical protein